MYLVDVAITLEPIWYCDCPLVEVAVPDQATIVSLDSVQTFEFTYTAVEKSWISVKFLNKTDSDTDLSTGLDKAVNIVGVGFFGIREPQFVWSGVYTPCYPAHIAGQPSQLTNTTYLAFNGEWKLDFDVPVFTWMHKSLNFGWIYN